MISFFKKVVLVLLLNVTLNACTDFDDCNLNDIRTVKITFSNTITNGKTPKTVSDTTISGVTVFAIGSDSIFYYNASLRQYNLNLPPSVDICKFVFIFNSRVKVDTIKKIIDQNNNITYENSYSDKDTIIIDTLTLKYSRKLQLISQNCGYNTIISLKKDEIFHTKNKIKNIETISTSLGTETPSNLRVYFNHNRDTIKTDTLVIKLN